MVEVVSPGLAPQFLSLTQCPLPITATEIAGLVLTQKPTSAPRASHRYGRVLVGGVKGVEMAK